jgi:hypothetical protein
MKRIYKTVIETTIELNEKGVMSSYEVNVNSELDPITTLGVLSIAKNSLIANNKPVIKEEVKEGVK